MLLPVVATSSQDVGVLAGSHITVQSADGRNSAAERPAQLGRVRRQSLARRSVLAKSASEPFYIFRKNFL